MENRQAFNINSVAIVDNNPRESEENAQEELCAQIANLPTEQQVEELCSVLRVATLRELALEVVNGGIDHLKGNISPLEYAQLLNSWIATAEETIAAGRNLNRIAGRRK